MLRQIVALATMQDHAQDQAHAERNSHGLPGSRAYLICSAIRDVIDRRASFVQFVSRILRIESVLLRDDLVVGPEFWNIIVRMWCGLHKYPGSGQMCPRE